MQGAAQCSPPGATSVSNSATIAARVVATTAAITHASASTVPTPSATAPCTSAPSATTISTVVSSMNTASIATTPPPEGQLLHRLIKPWRLWGRVLATAVLAAQCTGARQIPIDASMGSPPRLQLLGVIQYCLLQLCHVYRL